MMTKLGPFNKTEHFIYRQWDRCISDELLNSILENIDCSRNTLLIVSREVLKQNNLRIQKELFIKIDNTTLITCFFSEIQEYKVSNRNQNYQIINHV